MTVGETVPFGPGTLKFGATGSEIDVSCQVNSLTITMSKDQGDAVTKLCGTTRTPAPTYTYTMEGNIDVDLTDPEGLWALSQITPGALVPFVFTPNTAAATEATGNVYVDPMDFGGDEYGAIMASDVSWGLDAQPTYTVAGVPINAAALTTDDGLAGAAA